MKKKHIALNWGIIQAPAPTTTVCSSRWTLPFHCLWI